MVDVIWWRDDSFWERKSIPLMGFVLSPRQLVIIAACGLLGFLASLPVNVAAFGVAFVGKLAVVGVFLFLAFIVSSHRVKMGPVEMQVLYRLKGAGPEKKKGKGGEKEVRGRGMEKEAPIQIETGRDGEQELVVEDFARPIPLSWASTLLLSDMMPFLSYRDYRGRERLRRINRPPLRPDRCRQWFSNCDSAPSFRSNAEAFYEFDSVANRLIKRRTGSYHQCKR